MFDPRRLGPLLGSLSVALAVWGPVGAGGDVPALPPLEELLDRGDYVEAERVARDRLSEAHVTAGPDSIEAAELLDTIVESLLQRRCLGVAHLRSMGERALQIKTARLGDDHPDLVVSLCHLAAVELDAGEHDQALARLERARQIVEEHLAADHPERARVLAGLAAARYAEDRYADAAALYGEALDVREAAHDAADLSVLGTRIALGRALARAGRRPDACPAFRQARQVALDAFGPDHPIVGEALLGLAHCSLAHPDHYERALTRYARAAEIFEGAYGSQSPLLATALTGVGLVHFHLSDFVPAEQALMRALEIREEAFGPDHRRVGATLMHIGFFHSLRSDYAAARRAYERALAIFDRHPPTDYQLRGLLIRYGITLQHMGDLEAAREAFERSIGVAERLPDGRDDPLGRSLVLLGGLQMRLGQLDRAQASLERGLRLLERVGGPDHVTAVDARSLLALLRAERGELDAARRALRRNLKDRERLFGHDHFLVANVLDELARLAREAGDHVEAADLLQRALAIREEVYGPDGLRVAFTLVELARTHLDTGSTGPALDAALRAERIARTSLVLVARTLPERVALQYATVRTQGLDLALSAVTGGEPPGPAAVRKVADAVVRSRAVILDELANRHRTTVRADDPGLVALAEEVAAGRARLAGWIHRGPGPLATGDYVERVEAARREQERREARLAARSESFRRLRTARRTGLADVVAALPDGSAILSYVVFDRHPVGWTDMAEQGEPAAVRETDRAEVVPWYVAFVLRPGDRAPRVLPIGTSAEVDRRVQEWRREVSHLPPAVTLGARPAMQRYDRTAEALRRTVWDPAQRDLSDVTRLFVVPDGSLHLVSYATLRAPSGEFLIECGPLLHRLTAEKDLVASSKQMAARALLVVGGVDFDSPLGPAPQGSSRQMVAETAEEPGAAAAAVYRGGQPPCREFQQLRFERLPGSAREVDDVVRFWRTRRGPSEQTASHEAVRVLRGPEAHEGILKRLAGRYRYLHLATHGFFLDSACRQGRTIADETRGVSHSTETGGAFTGNALLLSGLALAGANHRESVRDEQEDGVLTAAELASLDLSGVEAVVLSGCATGLGEVAPGEGVLGLQRAFRIAGARRVIMSLWNVQDQSAREWMRELYDVPRTGLGDATSVRRASRRVLQRRETEGRSTHPFFWGAFIASGY